MARAAPFERRMRCPEKRLRQGEDRFRPHGDLVVRGAGGKNCYPVDSEFLQKVQRLILDHVGQGADKHQLAVPGFGQRRNHRGKTRVLALGECRLDAGPRIVENAHFRRMARAQPFGGAGKIQLDHLGGAGADQEELPDVGPPGEKPVDLALQFVLCVGQAGEIGFLQYGGAETGLGENHHAGRRLKKVGAGAASDDQKEGVPASCGAARCFPSGRRRPRAGRVA